MYFVYILKSLKDSGYYIGQTENLGARIKKHNNGLVKSTKPRIPFILVKEESFNTRGEARKRENYLKKLKGGNEFRKLLSKAAGSSNGRTLDSESSNSGSNPGPAALDKNNYKFSGIV